MWSLLPLLPTVDTHSTNYCLNNRYAIAKLGHHKNKKQKGKKKQKKEKRGRANKAVK